MAVFPSRWLALLAAAVLPGTGSLHLFDEPLVDALNVAIHLLQAPESLAGLLEAAGAVALERCDAILDERMSG